MLSRAISLLGTALAYIVAGIPALIGIGFVARFAFITSDTPADGLATAFLFGMAAAGAFAGPAIAVAVRNRGRKTAAVIWWALATLAIVANWTHTLSAIAQRGAGRDASRVKLSIDTAADRKTLERLERELGSLPPFTPTTAEAVAATRSAAEIAQRTRVVECGLSNETRGNRCRERESDERAKQDALTKALESKATTDRQSALESSAAVLRNRLANTPATPPENILGRTLGRLLPVSAATAATLQQAFVSAIVELLIAAVLALPELLRAPQRREQGAPSAQFPTPLEGEEPEIISATVEAPRTTWRRQVHVPHVPAVPAIAAPADMPIASSAATEIDPRPVVAFLAAHMPPDRGSRADWADIYGGFLASQSERVGTSLSASQFGAVLRHICEQANIRVRRQGDRVYCVDRCFKA
jgi:hypothetical protein